MVVKEIRVQPKPGHLRSYLSAQAIWNRQSRTSPGYLGESVGRVADDESIVEVLIGWRSRADLDRFMADEHDRRRMVGFGGCERP
ncbi:MAG: hypothetical protein CME06_02285 [Gemmatimonadetes bacterium]|nr:hypothetical protein [Gemmatimonadota bacterium]